MSAQKWIGVIGVACMALSAAAQNTFPATGNVGIGTTNPANLLDVEGGAIRIGTGLAEWPAQAIIAAGSDGHNINLFPSLGGGNYNNIVQAGDQAIIYSNGTLGSGGFVIAPLASTTSGLRMDGNGLVKFSRGTNNLVIDGMWGGVGSSGPVVLSANGEATPQLALATSGNVGIGTTTPGAQLEVNGAIKLTAGSGGAITFADGTTQSTAYNGLVCGGDYAESVDVTGDRKHYQPGDVLVIDPDAPGKFLKSAEPYSTSVAGIYSTKPGYVGRRQTTPKSPDEVPMAMVGIVPTKVSAENGPIHPGDILVTSSKLGYAMKGTDRSRLIGAVVGKALGKLDSGTGSIEVLVSLQ
jgi:hypothetical protein